MPDKKKPFLMRRQGSESLFLFKPEEIDVLPIELQPFMPDK